MDNATLAYVLSTKNGNVAEIVFIVDGDVYDSASTYFMLSKTTRESLKYDGDYYWEYTNAYVNGVKQSVYVDQDLGALEVGHLYKATKTVDEKYITGIEDVELKDNTVNARGDGAFWLTTVEDAKVKYDVDDDTVFVYVDVEPKNGENLSKGYDYTITDGDVKDMYVGTEEETYDGVKFDYMTYVTVVKDSNDHNTADLVYIIHKPVVEMVKVTLALTNATVTVNGVEYTENGSISVKKGTELNWTAKAKEGYNLTTPASGKVTANSDTTITATASADTLSVKVEGHAVANPTSITANQAADITVTAEKGYTITDVTCAQAAKIKSNGDGTWTVSVPAGTETVVINVATKADEYTVTYPQYWYDNNSGDQRELTKVNAPEKITTGGEINVELTTPWVGTTKFEVKVTGADFSFTKEDGWAQETDTANISTVAELKVLQNQFGKIYTDKQCQTECTNVTQATDVYWVTKEAKAPVWSGTISNPTGDVTVEFVWKG